MRPKNRIDAPLSRSGLGSLSAGAEAACGDITDHAGPVGPRATSAVPPRLFLRRTLLSYETRTNERETSARGAAIGRAATLAVWTSSAVSSRFAHPERNRNFRTRRATPRNFRTRRRSGRVLSDLYPAAGPTADGAETERGEAEGLRGRSRRVESDRASPGPTWRTSKTDMGEEIARRGVPKSSPLRPPAPGCGVARAGGWEATSANRRRQVDVVAQLPWALTRENPGAGEGLAGCAIVAEQSREFSRRSGGGKEGPKPKRRRRTRLATHHVGGAASVYVSGPLGRAPGKQRRFGHSAVSGAAPPPPCAGRYLAARTRRRNIAAS